MNQNQIALWINTLGAFCGRRYVSSLTLQELKKKYGFEQADILVLLGGSIMCGGAFARFANHPYKDKGREDIHKALQKIYSVYMPGFHSSKEYSENDAKMRADIARKYGFVDISYKLYHRTWSFPSKEYTSLLGTYSGHIAIEENTRNEFFSDIEKVIDNLGGKITIYDTIDLQLAKKP